MLSFLRRKTPFIPDYRVPSGTRLYVVGDIHGRADLLRRLMDQIVADAEGTPDWQKELIFLGDYIDRGLHSKDVIEYLLYELPVNFHATFLRGNHEDAMLRFMGGERLIAPSWFSFGGRETVASYGLPFPPPNPAADKIDDIHKALLEKMPEAHRNFLQGTVLHYQVGDYLFVHAGLRPGLPLERQMREDLLFIRNDFLLSSADFGVVVVHGHTISDRPEIRSNRIGIDTGAYATGRLTCLVLEGGERRFLQT